MNVNSYIFQSPSPSPVQVGRLDTSTQKEDTSSQTKQEEKVEETAQVSQSAPELKTQEVEPLTVTSANNTLDLYV